MLLRQYEQHDQFVGKVFNGNTNHTNVFRTLVDSQSLDIISGLGDESIITINVDNKFNDQRTSSEEAIWVPFIEVSILTFFYENNFTNYISI